MSDLFENHIVGFPTRRLIIHVQRQYCTIPLFLSPKLEISSHSLKTWCKYKDLANNDYTIVIHDSHVTKMRESNN